MSGDRARILSKIINRLRLEEGRTVSSRTLIDCLWGDDSEGGPDDASNVLRVHMFRLRCMGFPIRSRCGVGYYYQAGVIT